MRTITVLLLLLCAGAAQAQERFFTPEEWQTLRQALRETMLSEIAARTALAQQRVDQLRRLHVVGQLRATEHQVLLYTLIMEEVAGGFTSWHELGVSQEMLGALAFGGEVT